MLTIGPNSSYLPNPTNVTEENLVTKHTDLVIEVAAFGGAYLLGPQLEALDEAGVFNAQTFINPPSPPAVDGMLIEIADDEYYRYSLDLDQGAVSVASYKVGDQIRVNIEGNTAESIQTIEALVGYFNQVNIDFDYLLYTSSGQPTVNTDYGIVITDQNFLQKQLDLGVDLESENGANVIEGTENNDFLKGTEDADIIISGEGDDLIASRDGDDIIEAGEGNDTVISGQGNDEIDTGAGNDIIGAGAGEDTINSGEGNDKVFAGAGNDRVNTGEGNDVVHGNAGNDIIYTGDGIDIVKGGKGDDYINTGAGNDFIFGESGADRINAGEGNDVIFDYAGGGADTFVFNFDNDDVAEYDIIKGFNADIDSIELTGYGEPGVSYEVNQVDAGTEIVYSAGNSVLDTILLADVTLDEADIIIDVAEYLE